MNIETKKAWKMFKEYVCDFIETKNEDYNYHIIDRAEYNVLTAIQNAECFSDVFEKLHGETEFKRFAGMLRDFIEDEIEEVIDND